MNITPREKRLQKIKFSDGKTLLDYKKDYEKERLNLLNTQIQYTKTLIDYMEENDDITDFTDKDNEYYDDIEKEIEEQNIIYEEQLEEEQNYYDYLNGLIDNDEYYDLKHKC